MNIQEKSQVRGIIQSPQWRTCEQVAKDMQQAWREESNLRPTMEETAMNVAREEGRIEGINKFIQELYRISNE